MSPLYVEFIEDKIIIIIYVNYCRFGINFEIEIQ